MKILKFYIRSIAELKNNIFKNLNYRDFQGNFKLFSNYFLDSFRIWFIVNIIVTNKTTY